MSPSADNPQFIPMKAHATGAGHAQLDRTRRSRKATQLNGHSMTGPPRGAHVTGRCSVMQHSHVTLYILYIFTFFIYLHATWCPEIHDFTLNHKLGAQQF